MATRHRHTPPAVSLSMTSTSRRGLLHRFGVASAIAAPFQCLRNSAAAL
jgi:hypothetical protein